MRHTSTTTALIAAVVLALALQACSTSGSGDEQASLDDTITGISETDEIPPVYPVFDTPLPDLVDDTPASTTPGQAPGNGTVGGTRPSSGTGTSGGAVNTPSLTTPPTAAPITTVETTTTTTTTVPFDNGWEWGYQSIGLAVLVHVQVWSCTSDRLRVRVALGNSSPARGETTFEVPLNQSPSGVTGGGTSRMYITSPLALPWGSGWADVRFSARLAGSQLLVRTTLTRDLGQILPAIFMGRVEGERNARPADGCPLPALEE